MVLVPKLVEIRSNGVRFRPLAGRMSLLVRLPLPLLDWKVGSSNRCDFYTWNVVGKEAFRARSWEMSRELTREL